MAKAITPKEAYAKNKAVDDVALDTTVNSLNDYLAEHAHAGSGVIVPITLLGPAAHIRQQVARLYVDRGWFVRLFGTDQYVFSDTPN